MPNIGGPELLLILAVVLIVFGAGKLPDVLGQLGKGVRSFRDEAQNEKPAQATAGSASAASAAGRNARSAARSRAVPFGSIAGASTRRNEAPAGTDRSAMSIHSRGTSVGSRFAFAASMRAGASTRRSASVATRSASGACSRRNA